MTKLEFEALHRGADPLVLFNIWDAGSARAVANAGSRAIATGSLALAGAQGYADGEELPFKDLLSCVRLIARATDLPLTVDFETGYAECLAELAANAAELRGAGAIGCNLEDRIIGGDGLRDVAEQAERIAAVASEGLFVNARTDLFLTPWMAGENPNRKELVEEAAERAKLFKAAGAGCFFAPGLSDPALISDLCHLVDIPVNIMRLPDMASNRDLSACGVARISYGPGPWRQAMDLVEREAKVAVSG